MSDFKAGDLIEFSDGGAVRIDRVTDAWVYFVSWPPGAETGAPKRMPPRTFARAVESHRADAEDNPHTGDAR